MKNQQKAQKNIHHCFVALGSNLGDSEKILQTAIETLESYKQISKILISKFYQSRPHGPQDQPDYLNAAAYFKTSLEPEALLNILQKIENENGRERKDVTRWGARTLDLDLLFYDDETIKTERLTVPHPRICERAFVLLPLHDLMQKLKIDLNLDKQTSIQDCIDQLPKDELDNIQETDL